MGEIRQSPEAEERIPPPREVWYVWTGRGTWPVSRRMAVHIERMLDARRPPVWVVFVDVAGSRVRVRASAIHGIEESTPEQRASARAFSEALSEEEEEQGSDGWR